MKNSKLWSHDGRVLKIFDVYSCIHEKELYIGESRACMTKVKLHERASSAINGQLTNLDHGYGKKHTNVQYVQVNEYTAHLLFAEGLLSIDMLRDADEDEKNIFIPMIFHDLRRIISIRNDLNRAILYFSPSGKPIKYA